MKKDDYNPGVKSYEPMMQTAFNNAMDNFYDPCGPSKNYNTDTPNYNPVLISRKPQKIIYKVRTFLYHPIRDEDLLFREKEAKIREYKPVNEPKKIDSRSYTIPKNLFRGGSVFTSIFKGLMQKINRFFKRFRR